ncbi:hypothetical protein ACFFMR_14250 [Micromonospora andamanensis]|uniref:TnpV protein n=1 Tax=Micromonospora andamanensis TaxID=1287068 RepID=A0ABQ4I2Y6_9ACTN|nr:hypothetical protein [Micromonospora andamanensis]GIJ12222.1 hypothetical protein Van01_54360 [Micromonospora andamanensis]
MLNLYGAQAKEHWTQTWPDRVREMEDPEAFFARLGQDIEAAIETTTRTLAGPAPAGEGYLSRLQRLNTARHEAESHVMRRMVYLEPDETE